MSDSSRIRLPLVPVARAKPLPRRLPIALGEPLLVPARMVNEVMYCERLMALEWSHAEFADNEFTVEGRVVHRRADEPTGALPNAEVVRAEDEKPYVARAVWLSSDELGMTAKIDVVEIDDKRVVPIEYKRGEAPDVPEGAYIPERAQLAVQALLLRAHGYDVPHGEIYFAKSKRRVVIALTDELVETAHRAVARARELVADDVLPPPLRDSPKCQGCSLVAICLPDETYSLMDADARARHDETPEGVAPTTEIEDGEEKEGPAEELRRLAPARDDALPLYVTAQGGRVSLAGEELVVWTRTEDETRARLPNTSQVALLGNVQVSTQAMRALIERDIPVTFFSAGGWFFGRTQGHGSKNVILRTAQYRAADDEEFCLAFARGITASKIRNCRTMLRRNHEDADATALFELEQLAKKSEAAPALESLLGIEGTAARTYFSQFSGMLKEESREGFDFAGRNRRPPKDPINALLSLAYALLTKDVSLAAGASGLDPLRGFYHQPRFGRPGLALDLMEEFRPLLADSTVIGVINGGVVTPRDFIVRGTGVALTPAGRKAFISAYERRMDQLVTHPLFGYRLSYRRVLELQARLLGRVLLGELTEYPEFRTR